MFFLLTFSVATYIYLEDVLHLMYVSKSVEMEIGSYEGIEGFIQTIGRH